MSARGLLELFSGRDLGRIAKQYLCRTVHTLTVRVGKPNSSRHNPGEFSVSGPGIQAQRPLACNVIFEITENTFHPVPSNRKCLLSQ